MNDHRPIPAELWNEIAFAVRASEGTKRGADIELRQQITRAAAKHGFTAAELEQRGLIEPDPSAKLPDNRANKVHVGRSKHEAAR